jgi:hydrogenase-1 operon protein HyaF
VNVPVDVLEATALVAARDELARFACALRRWTPSLEPHGPTLDVSRAAPSVLEVVDRMLGGGDVDIAVSGARRMRAHETICTGIWRVRELDDAGDTLADRFEAGVLPRAVLDRARAAAIESVPSVVAARDAANARTLLAEIAARQRVSRTTGVAHVVNLTLFPLDGDDHALLDRMLPDGPVAIVARAFGHCRVTSTLARDVWRVRYFNDSHATILDTIEVIDVPDVVVASAADVDDGRQRLTELVQWMSECCPA